MDNHPIVKRLELTRGYVCVVDDADYETLKQYKWCAYISESGLVYAVRRASGRVCRMHRLLLGLTEPTKKVDHRNGDTLDNRRFNLRAATNKQNLRAFQRKRSAATSTFRGVSKCGQTGRWRAQITVDAQNRHLGRFSTQVLAARAYDTAAREAFKEFACPNFK